MKRVQQICSHFAPDLKQLRHVGSALTAGQTASASAKDSKTSTATSPSNNNFFDLHSHQLLRVSAIIPALHLADPLANAKRIATLFAQAASNGAAVVAFPELSLAGYSLDDLHQQEALLRSVLEAIAYLRDATRFSTALLLVGGPIRIHGRLLNCAITLSHGKILGLNPKTYLPNYREFYELRQFASGSDIFQTTVEILGQEVPIGNDIVYRCSTPGFEDFTLHVEICEDIWVPIPPSTFAALGGAHILVNLSASNITVGKSDYRRELVRSHSAKCIAACIYTAAGPGESTTDLAWDGMGLVTEDGAVLAESNRFVIDGSQVVYADIDVGRLAQERMRQNTFGDNAMKFASTLSKLRTVKFSYEPDASRVFRLQRTIEPQPYVPSDPAKRNERCYEVYNIQVSGLVQRMAATGIKKIVIGVSGGLDSTNALIVAVRALDLLRLPRSNILAYTMPAYATSDLTKSSAIALMKALNVTWEVLDIVPSCNQMFKDLKHPYAEGKKVYDVTFENVQAGERTNHLFRLANHHNAIVLGTGDVSELALGWCTYGVGDHMSHYNVNASVPKTLIQYVIRWVADQNIVGEDASPVLRAILETEISPELVPADDSSADHKKPAQSTESTIGPYNLHDFFLFYTVRRGFMPSKVVFLAHHAWHGKYDMPEILKWMRAFLDRFFRTAQFKRTCVPNAPKVGDGSSLSPRGDWRAPSDSSPAVWLRQLQATTEWIAKSSSAKTTEFQLSKLVHLIPLKDA